MIEQVLYKIYNYVILQYVARSKVTRQLFNSTDKQKKTDISLGARILEI